MWTVNWRRSSACVCGMEIVGSSSSSLYLVASELGGSTRLGLHAPPVIC